MFQLYIAAEPKHSGSKQHHRSRIWGGPSRVITVSPGISWDSLKPGGWNHPKAHSHISGGWSCQLKHQLGPGTEHLPVASPCGCLASRQNDSWVPSKIITIERRETGKRCTAFYAVSKVRQCHFCSFCSSKCVTKAGPYSRGDILDSSF